MSGGIVDVFGTIVVAVAVEPAEDKEVGIGI